VGLEREVIVQFCVIYERAENGGWGAFPPALPGVAVVGRTYEEVRDRIKVAIEMHIDGMRLDEIDVPESTAVAVELVKVDWPTAHERKLKRPA
jgi:predicted RNase H-like HicB family nuclease